MDCDVYNDMIGTFTSSAAPNLSSQADGFEQMLSVFRRHMSEIISEALAIEGIENPTEEDVDRLWNFFDADDLLQQFLQNRLN